MQVVLPESQCCPCANTLASSDVKYAVLHYLYSGPAVTQEWDSRLLGISLDLPSSGLDGSTPFTPPPAKAKSTQSSPPSTNDPTSFLWQAPNSNAALFTGQKWMELHALVSNLLAFQQQHGTSQPLPTFFTTKQVSKKPPAWLEHALRLARARGYFTLYPSISIARSLATVHSELYRAPEEYERELPKERDPEMPVPVPGGTLVDSLPGRGRLLGFDEMPLLLWDGRPATLEGLDQAAAGYAEEFRRAVGGCQGLAAEELVAGRKSMGDLFCLRED